LFGWHAGSSFSVEELHCLTFKGNFGIYERDEPNVDSMKQGVVSFHDDQSLKGLKVLRRELILEGSGKNLYQCDKPDLAILEFKSRKSSENGKEPEPKDLALLRNKISSYLFKYLDGFHIPTHFVNMLSETEVLVKRLEIIPIVVRIHNLASGTLPKRFNLKEGSILTFPVVEHYHKSADRNASWMNEYHVYTLGLATPEEFKQINRIASKVNAVLRALCDRRQLLLVDLEMVFGRYKGQVVLGDELSPLTCHFLDLQQENKNGKARFINDQADAVNASAALSDRLELKI
jgi:phosphoribosylaminoimidazole-succinocarboxamide synthase